ncbi:MAG TPA: GGDEF domain-containing protein [Herpetosiphon sp.]|uniref:Diguanylate cyclase/phosphodiesterase with PAS/PAC sensor(S) n=2 Tax=Herpetosiphon TaxID=64 RepID=A9B049_HERA2|nr:diguanylate cyclase/phosphodiesterase with PAS/PAC sensor(s) [Herpetosiphon aurantiacus DSM 785]HBW49060.1 GGDEF domain-containing protein [Herpetosiphon sp.]
MSVQMPNVRLPDSAAQAAMLPTEWLLIGLVCGLGIWLCWRWQRRRTAQRISTQLGLWHWPHSQQTVIIDQHATIIAISPLLNQQLGYPALSLNGQSFKHLLHPDSSNYFEQLLHTQTTQIHWQMLRCRHADGSWRGLEFCRHQVGRYWLLNCRETEPVVTAQRTPPACDWLTGLPNRQSLVIQLQRLIAQRQLDQQHFAVLFVEVDRFSAINDALGYDVGDQVLQTIAQRLQSTLGPNDLAARLGGDEFVVVLGHVQHAQQALEHAQRIQEQFSQPIVLRDKPIYTTLGIGVTLGDGQSQAETLLREADTAMYQAKTNGISQIFLFDRALHAALAERWQLEIDLRGALERHELILHYQPITALPTGQMVGVEALLRWHHPQRGMILPNEFIHLAEESGLIVPIGFWALETACLQFLAWQADYSRPRLQVLSVNLSARQLASPALVQTLGEIIQRTGINPAQLELEITESMVIHGFELARAQLGAIKNLGVKLAIDDFGTGYSSLSYLHHFPLDTLKVDRSFVNAMSDGSRNVEIVRAIIMLSQQLAMNVIAEGIETIEEAATLRDLGCDYGQGYHFSRPMTAPDITSWLHSQPLSL